MTVTIEDVAKEAGVSITTVSRVVNDNYPVKIETRQRVEEAIKKLNYRPNPIAVSLVRKTTNIIGVIVPGISNMYFSDVVSGIEKYFIIFCAYSLRYFFPCSFNSFFSCF